MARSVRIAERPRGTRGCSVLGAAFSRLASGQVTGVDVPRVQQLMQPGRGVQRTQPASSLEHVGHCFWL